MDNPGQNKKVITVHYHGQAGSIEFPRNGTLLDLKRQMSVDLSVPVEKLVFRVSGCPYELIDNAVPGDRWIICVHVKVNIVVKVGGTKYPIDTYKDSNGMKIKQLVAEKMKNNGLLNMKLGLVDGDANNQVVSVGDDTPLYIIKDGAEFVLE